MRLKSYFAPSVDEAIERARVELGPEAMLLNSRKIAPEQAHLGSYEVVFGITGEMLQRAAPAVASSARAAAAAPASRAALPAPVIEVATKADGSSPSAEPVSKRQARKTAQKARRGKSKIDLEAVAEAVTSSAPEQPGAEAAAPVLADELAELRRQIQAVQNSLSQNSLQGAIADTRMQVTQEEAYQRLVDFDFSDRVARRFLEATANLAKSGNHDASSNARLAHALVSEINARFEVAPRLGKGNSDQRIVMFVGPPGAGKTTTVAKLAVRLGIQRRLPVQLLTLDTMRVNGSEQLAEYARILGVDFQSLYSTAELDQVLEECSHKKLILIDTPGYAPAEMDEAEENAYFLKKHPEIEVQLVLPASLRASALEKFSERFAVFNPTKLLFTHLDEVETFGPLLEHAMKTSLPVSYLTHGQSIPQDIEEASKSRLTEGLFAQLDGAAASAA